MVEDDPDDFRAHLSDGARASLDSTDFLYHTVNLERVQRIHLNLDSEVMDFSASSVANMISDVADQCDEHEAFILRAVVNALNGNDDHHELVLRQKKRGKFVNPTVHQEKHDRQMKWLWWLAHRENAGIKTESAIAEISSSEGVSRATVFGGIRAAEKFLDIGREMFPGNENFTNPRPAKEGKG
ncbi:MULTISPECIES: hypothetical protein [unclassified Sphingobium]|uniref:hypothetical protein n=1 Tax=unclassified Sphingobium TaxID=2611147 RepID=UPI000D40EDCA|nr:MULTISPECIES: hypothetical protein [unclassified Sphingobium]PSO13633.1 hypothetical protein C7E20_00980 [Sphingobium sp. AEW4]TWD10629.1 hypothetical protein FB595_103195 [Sphingobium sp. AEW010]TWD27966.1 hypothetical protein FB596_103120 [Sphingobium sp. AEW013]TWD28963.1 hypothetical protein FB594_103195 [Sphingobium sp. AEW001]